MRKWPCPKCGQNETYHHPAMCLDKQLAEMTRRAEVAEHAAELVQCGREVGCIKQCRDQNGHLQCWLDCMDDVDPTFDSGVELDVCPACLLAQAYALADAQAEESK